MRILGIELRSPFTTQMNPSILSGMIGADTSSITDYRSDATSLAAIDLICNAVAGITFDIYDRETRTRQDDYFLQKLLRNPNSDDTKSTFQYQIAHDYFEGNVFIYKYVDNTTGEIIAMFRINPLTVSLDRDLNNQKVFTFNGRTYDWRSVLHIPSRYLYDGTRGYSIFDYAKTVFHTNKDIEDYTLASFTNSLGKRLVIDISRAFPNATPDQIEAIRAKYVSAYTGSGNAGKPVVKSNNIEFTSLDSGASDSRASQLIENRAFQSGEIGKLFPVALSILTGQNSYGDIEGLYNVFVDTCLKPICNPFQEYFNKLIPVVDRDRLYCEANYNSLMKANLSTRIATYASELNNGILSINEIRAKENLPPLEDKVAGDTHFVPSNLMPARADVIDAYMASAKLKQLEVANNAPTVGSDKQ